MALTAGVGCQKKNDGNRNWMRFGSGGSGWELAVLSLLEPGEVDAMSSLKRFMQQAIDNDEMPAIAVVQTRGTGRLL